MCFLQYVLNIDVFGATDRLLKSRQQRKDEYLHPERDVLRDCVIADLSDSVGSYIHFLREMKSYHYDRSRRQKVVTLDLFQIRLSDEKVQIRGNSITYSANEIMTIAKQIRKRGKSRIYVNKTEYDIVFIPRESKASLYIKKIILAIEEILSLKKLEESLESKLSKLEEKAKILGKSELSENDAKEVLDKIEAIRHRRTNARQKISRNKKLIEKMAIPIFASNSDELFDKLNA